MEGRTVKGDETMKQEEKSAQPPKRGRPPTRTIKLDATPEEVARAIFAGAKKPDPATRT